MSKNFKIFCLTIYPKYFDKFIKLGLTPVGLGKRKFDSRFFRDNTGDNISKKNNYFGEYTFHYWLWKNYLEKLKKYEWIGFCTYRRFWTKEYNKEGSIKNFPDLNKSILKNFKQFSKYDSIITDPIIFKGNYKMMKIIKNYGLLNSIFEPSIFFKKKKNIYDHFKIFHGKKYIDEAINLLENKEKIKFKNFLLNNNKFNPHNLFIVKNVTILKEYYDHIFPWLFKCEREFKKYNFSGYEIRKLAFLAELYCNYWFKNKSNYYENHYIFFDTNKKF